MKGLKTNLECGGVSKKWVGRLGEGVGGIVIRAVGRGEVGWGGGSI